MRRPLSVRSVFLSLLEVFLVFEPSRASVAIPASALFLSDFSLAASWAYSFQQALAPDYGPRLPSLRGELGQDLVAI
jgi:hypothetical protein